MPIVVIYCDESFQISYDTKDLIEHSASNDISSSPSMQVPLTKMISDLCLEQDSEDKFPKMSVKQEKHPRKKIVVHEFNTIANIGFMNLRSRSILKCLMKNCNFTTYHSSVFESHLRRHLNDGEVRKSVSACDSCKKQIKATNLLGEFVHLMEKHVKSAVENKVGEKTCARVLASGSFIKARRKCESPSGISGSSSKISSNQLKTSDSKKLYTSSNDTGNLVNKKEFKIDEMKCENEEKLNLIKPSDGVTVEPAENLSPVALSKEKRENLQNDGQLSAILVLTEATKDEISNSCEIKESSVDRENLNSFLEIKGNEPITLQNTDLHQEFIKNEFTPNEVTFEVSNSRDCKIEEQSEEGRQKENLEPQKYVNENENDRKMTRAASIDESPFLKSEQRFERSQNEGIYQEEMKNANLAAAAKKECSKIALSPSKPPPVKINSSINGNSLNNDSGVFLNDSAFCDAENVAIDPKNAENDGNNLKLSEKIVLNREVKRKFSRFFDAIEITKKSSPKNDSAFSDAENITTGLKMDENQADNLKQPGKFALNRGVERKWSRFSDAIEIPKKNLSNNKSCVILNVSAFSNAENITTGLKMDENQADNLKQPGKIVLNRGVKRKWSRFSDAIEVPKKNCLETEKEDKIISVSDSNAMEVCSSEEKNEKIDNLTDVLVLNDDDDENSIDKVEWIIIDHWEESPEDAEEQPEVVEEKPELTEDPLKVDESSLKIPAQRERIKYEDENVLNEPKTYDGRSLMPWKKIQIRKNYKTKRFYDKMLSKLSLANLFKCMEANCDFTTKIPERFENHIKQHGSASPGTRKFFGMCAYCDFSHPVAANLVEHVERIHGFSPYQCPNCFYRSNKAETCFEHLREHHPGSSDAIIECPGRRRSQVSINRRNNWMWHKHVRPLTCNGCSSDFYLISSLKWHNCTSRSSLKKSLEKISAYKCIYCPFGGFTLEEISKHMIIHPTEARFCCYRDSLTHFEYHLSTSSESVPLLPIVMDFKMKIEIFTKKEQ